MRLNNLVRIGGVATVAVAFLFSTAPAFADDARPEAITGIWTIKTHKVGDKMEDSKSENEKTGATWKFRKDGTWKPGESNTFLYWSYSDTTKELETWDTVLGYKAKGTVCHYDIEFSRDGRTMTWKGKNMFGIKQLLVLEKK